MISCWNLFYSCSNYFPFLKKKNEGCPQIPKSRKFQLQTQKGNLLGCLCSISFLTLILLTGAWTDPRSQLTYAPVTTVIPWTLCFLSVSVCMTWPFCIPFVSNMIQNTIIYDQNTFGVHTDIRKDHDTNHLNVSSMIYCN